MRDTLAAILEWLSRRSCDKCKHNTLFGICGHPSKERYEQCTNSIWPKAFERRKRKIRGNMF